MIAFINDHRGTCGVEPICAVQPIAPSSYHTHAARRADPSRLPARAKRDASLMPEIARVFEENFQVYGVRKVWRQLRREGQEVALSETVIQPGLRGDGGELPRRVEGRPSTPDCPYDRRAPKAVVHLRCKMRQDRGAGEWFGEALPGRG